MKITSPDTFRTFTRFHCLPERVPGTAGVSGLERQGHPEPFGCCLWWKGLLRIRGVCSQGGAPPSARHCDPRRPSHPPQKTESCVKLMEPNGETNPHSSWRPQHPCVSTDGAADRGQRGAGCRGTLPSSRAHAAGRKGHALGRGRPSARENGDHTERVTPRPAEPNRRSMVVR